MAEWLSLISRLGAGRVHVRLWRKYKSKGVGEKLKRWGHLDTTTGPRAVLGSQRFRPRDGREISLSVRLRWLLLRAEDGSRSVPFVCSYNFKTRSEYAGTLGKGCQAEAE